MQYLLDTHVLLWFAKDSGELPKEIRGLIASSPADFCVSIASYWEIGIKVAIGKLSLNGSVSSLQSRIERMNLQTVALSTDAIDLLSSLPNHHKDPFDRILVATAITDAFVIVTDDSMIAKYDVPRHWTAP